MTYSKKLIGAVLLGCSLQIASAQNNYIKHTLQQGETLSMLAKQYNTSVGDIMRMNGMHADTKLVYGSPIKIPSTKKQTTTVAKTTEPVAVTAPPPAASSGEVTHIVAKGETLYSISKKYNITVDQIKAWNNITDNSVNLGTLLIISEHGKNKFASTAATTQKATTETVAAPQTQKEPVIESKPDNTTTATTPVDNVTANMQPVMNTVSNMSSAPVTNDITTYSGEGAFADQFKEKKSKNLKNVTGISKTFKTASGWADGKYYILANDIEPGTIVKVTAGNGTSVYAKVLWNMGDLKDNAGINFRVSNATAAALHVNEPSFNLNLSF